jgi:tetratricopeptide (TPR) repeat protein
MRAALDHSWWLLDDNERCTLARLSVFRGGCEREAAREITGATLLTITALLDKSLLRTESVDGVTRYRLHELVRQYAAERLADDQADYDATAQRYAQYYATLIQQLIDPRTGASTPEHQATLNRNIDNFRTAWEHAVETRNVLILGMMMQSFWMVYDQQNWLDDGVALFGRATDALRTAEGAAVVRGYLLGLQGYFLTRVARYREAHTIAGQGVALLRANGITEGLAAVLLYYGVGLCHVGQIDAARDHFAEAVQCAQTTNDRFVQLWSELWLAVVASFRGDYQTAEPIITNFIATFRELGYTRGVGNGLGAMGEIARCTGHYDRAVT